jgi:hypothetical protein
MVPELAAGRFRVRRLLHKYNNEFPEEATPQSLVAARTDILMEVFGKAGKGIYIEPPMNVDYGCNISVGNNFYANFGYGSRSSQIHVLLIKVSMIGRI